MLGLMGTPFVVAAVLEDRAVRGVGALMSDFFGVSVNCLLRAPNVDDEGVDFGPFIAGLALLPAVTKGCRRAVCGFILRSGSHTRHFATKSTNSSSLHRRTWARVFVPGRRRRPLELMTVRGAPFVSSIPSVTDSPSIV